MLFTDLRPVCDVKKLLSDVFSGKFSMFLKKGTFLRELKEAVSSNTYYKSFKLLNP